MTEQMITVERLTTNGRLPYSALIARPREGVSPLGLLACVHGGGMTSGYFDSPVDPGLSVLRAFASAGFIAFAPDRPGYGETPAQPDLDLDGQAEWLATCLADLRKGAGLELPLGVVGHSMGSMISVAFAARHSADMFALAVSGVTAEYRLERRVDVGPHSAGAQPPSSELWWGDRSLYPEGALSQKNRPTAPVSSADRAVAPFWAELLPELAPRCEVPVQAILGDADQWWVGGEYGLQSFAKLFSAAPWFEIHEQAGAAHNMALGWAARPYALQVLSFLGNAMAPRTS